MQYKSFYLESNTRVPPSNCKRNPKYAHHDLCEKSIYYGKTDKEKEAMKEEKKRRQKDGCDKRVGMAEAEKALTQLFGDSEAKQLLQRAESEKRKENFRREKIMKESTEYNRELTDEGVEPLAAEAFKSSQSKKGGFFENILSADYLCDFIDKDETKQVTRAPKAVESIIKCIHGLSPNLKRGCNEIARGVDNEAKARWFRQTFPPGTIVFKVPRQNATVRPHAVYKAAEDVKIAFVRWELQTDKKLTCPLCKNGELIHGRFGIKKTSVHAIIDIGGKVMWSMVMHYNCSACNKTIRGDDQVLLDSLPEWMRETYPCHPKWNANDALFRLSREMTRMLEHYSLFNGGAKYITRTLEDLYFEDQDRFLSAHKLWLYSQGNPETKDCVPPLFMTFQEWLGEVEIPTALQLQTFRDEVHGVPPTESGDDVLLKSLSRSKKVTDTLARKRGDEGNQAQANRVYPMHMGYPGMHNPRGGIPQPFMVPPYPLNGPPGYMHEGPPHMIGTPFQPQGFPHGPPMMPPPGSIIPPGGMFIPVDKIPPWLRSQHTSAKKSKVDESESAKKKKDELTTNNGISEEVRVSENSATENDVPVESIGDESIIGEKEDVVKESLKRGNPEEEEKDRDRESDADMESSTLSTHCDPSAHGGVEILATKAASKGDGETEEKSAKGHEADDLQMMDWQNIPEGSFVFVPYQSSQSAQNPPSQEESYQHGPLGSPTKNDSVANKRQVEESKTSVVNKKFTVSGTLAQYGPGPSIQHQYPQGPPYMFPPMMGPGYTYQSYPPPGYGPYSDAVHHERERKKKKPKKGND
jgi:hypothetical protein